MRNEHCFVVAWYGRVLLLVYNYYFQAVNVVLNHYRNHLTQGSLTLKLASSCILSTVVLLL